MILSQAWVHLIVKKGVLKKKFSKKKPSFKAKDYLFENKICFSLAYIFFDFIDDLWKLLHVVFHVSKDMYNFD